MFFWPVFFYPFSSRKVNLMSPEIMQLLFYAGFTVLGWWLRHRGLAAPANPVTPPVITPASTGGHVTEATLLQLLESLLTKLNAQPTK
jgi:hypothetical protein